MKQCLKCGESQDTSQFNKQARAKDGLFPHCKSCRKSANKIRYKSLGEKITKQVKEWQAKNPDKVKLAKERHRKKILMLKLINVLKVS